MNDDPYAMGPMYDILIEPFLARIKRLTVSLLEKKLSGRSNPLILEMACGTGTQSRLLADRGFRVVALDKSRSMIRKANRKRRKKAEGSLISIRGDASRLPFQPAVFDGVVFQMALHEMNSSIRKLSLLESIRVAKTDAPLIFVDFIPIVTATAITHTLTFIEWLAGKEHFRNGQEFLKTGGLLTFLAENGLDPEPVRNFFQDHISLAVAKR
jgi:ubiquinone/menaquinone biosynthesis C-methylase UbiE